MMREKGLVVLLLLVLSVPIFLTEKVEASPAPLLFINPYRVTHWEIDTDKFFDITIEVSNLAGPADGGESLYGWSLTLSWDTAKLEFIDGWEGPLLPSGGYDTFWVTPIVNEAAGEVILGDSRTGAAAPGAVGSGAIATLRFRVDVEGVSDLHLYEVKLRNNILLPLEPNTGAPDYYFTNNQDGKYGPPIPQDITALKGIISYEAAIDIFDLASVGIKWGWTGTPGAIPEDVVEDGAVDIDDLISVAIEWGYYF